MSFPYRLLILRITCSLTAAKVSPWQDSRAGLLLALSPVGGAKVSCILGGKKALFLFISAPDLVIYCLAFWEVFDSKGNRARRRSGG